jgi:hypothetical protein
MPIPEKSGYRLSGIVKLSILGCQKVNYNKVGSKSQIAGKGEKSTLLLEYA